MKPITAFTLRVATALTLVYGFSGVSHASLILVSPTPLSGQGLGAVATVLTLNSQGQATTESGCISPSGTTNCGFTNSTVQQQSQVQPYSGTAANLRVIFNANEAASDNLVTLNSLVLNVYSGSTLIFSSGALSGAPLNFVPFQGTGSAGYQFQLDNTQAGQLQTALNTAGGANIQVGLGAALSNASAGLETFSIAAVTGPISDTPVPEPSTYALVGMGLVVTSLAARRRMRS